MKSVNLLSIAVLMMFLSGCSAQAKEDRNMDLYHLSPTQVPVSSEEVPQTKPVTPSPLQDRGKLIDFRFALDKTNPSEEQLADAEKRWSEVIADMKPTSEKEIPATDFFAVAKFENLEVIVLLGSEHPENEVLVKQDEKYTQYAVSFEKLDQAMMWLEQFFQGDESVGEIRS